MVLADMGADVIKVEAPNVGDYLRQIPPIQKNVGMSGRFLAVNRNKRSLALDLKREIGKQAFLKMAESADVIVETFRPGVMKKLGLDFESLRKHNPNIILCSISGYGQSGPYQKRAGHDLNYIGLSGVLAMGGNADAPMMSGTQIADLAGGGLWGVTAILGALIGRPRMGAQHLDLSMTEGSLALMAAELGNLHCRAEHEQTPTRGHETLNGGVACYGVYETKDNKFLSVGALEPKFWLAFNKAIGRDANPGEVMAPPARQEEIREEVAAILRSKTRAEWQNILCEHDCCVEEVLELDELAQHPLHQERGVFFTIPGEKGPVWQVKTPVGPARAGRLAPRLGEQSEEVLRQFGFSDESIQELLS
jgi:crotonobetainyl-CoA:carnitine CoA-transferase CaiB-like acyl-CoA transferase